MKTKLHSLALATLLLAAGLASNPRPPERTAVVTPAPTAMELLAGRRARMVDLATSREGS